MVIKDNVRNLSSGFSLLMSSHSHIMCLSYCGSFVFSTNVNSLNSWTVFYSHSLPMCSYHLSRHLMIAEQKDERNNKTTTGQATQTTQKAFERIKKLPLECSIYIKAIVEIMWFVKYDITGLVSVSSYFYTTWNTSHKIIN